MNHELESGTVQFWRHSWCRRFQRWRGRDPAAEWWRVDWCWRWRGSQSLWTGNRGSIAGDRRWRCGGDWTDTDVRWTKRGTKDFQGLTKQEFFRGIQEGRYQVSGVTWAGRNQCGMEQNRITESTRTEEPKLNSALHWLENVHSPATCGEWLKVLWRSWSGWLDCLDLLVHLLGIAITCCQPLCTCTPNWRINQNTRRRGKHSHYLVKKTCNKALNLGEII